MNKRDAKINDATVANGPLTQRGTETQVRRGTEKFSPASSPAQIGDGGRDQLVEDREAGRAPTDLLGYLPDPAMIRRASLIELVRVDMECRWLRENRSKRLADYCVEYPELLDEPLPAELVYEEFRLRWQGGEKVAVPEYLTEFPAQAEALENLIERDAAAGKPATVALESSGFGRFEIGQRCDDFELTTEIGKGAFARVFLARQLSMRRWVALKISRNVGVEPQTLAQLDHPHIIRVFDPRVLDDQALRVLIMEYVPGGTLLDVVGLVRRTPPELWFLLTFHAVRCRYPILLSHGEVRSGDGRDLHKLRRMCMSYLAVAASVPLVGIAGLSVVGGGAGEDVNATVRLLCLFGIFRFASWVTWRRSCEADHGELP